MGCSSRTSARASGRGILDKYVGDGIIAFFGGNDNAARGMRAGRAMLAALNDYDSTHPDRQPIRIGVAIHTGRVVVGTIGAPQRREYTLIGDAVNVAARLEEYNKRFGSQVVASVETLNQSDAPKGDMQGPELVNLRGRGEPVSVHYLPA